MWNPNNKVVIVNLEVKRKAEAFKQEITCLGHQICNVLQIQQNVVNRLTLLQEALSACNGVKNGEKPAEIHLKYVESLNSDYEADAHYLVHRLDSDVRELKERITLWKLYQEILELLLSASELIIDRLNSINTTTCADSYNFDIYWPDVNNLPKKTRILYWGRYLNQVGKEVLEEVSFLAEKKWFLIDNYQKEQLYYFRGVLAEINNRVKELDNEETD